MSPVRNAAAHRRADGVLFTPSFQIAHKLKQLKHIIICCQYRQFTSSNITNAYRHDERIIIRIIYCEGIANFWPCIQLGNKLLPSDFRS